MIFRLTYNIYVVLSRICFSYNFVWFTLNFVLSLIISFSPPFINCYSFGWFFSCFVIKSVLNIILKFYIIDLDMFIFLFNCSSVSNILWSPMVFDLLVWIFIFPIFYKLILFPLTNCLYVYLNLGYLLCVRKVHVYFVKNLTNTWSNVILKPLKFYIRIH